MIETRLPVEESAPLKRLDANGALGRLEFGTTCMQQDRYEPAVAEFTAALADDPNNAAALSKRGDAHRVRGHYAAAILDYSMAIRLDPNNVELYLNRGLANWLFRKAEAAVADFDQVLRLDPGSATARNSRGIALAALGNHDAAIADYSEVLHHDPGHTWACQNRGLSYSDREEYDLAIADFAQVLRANPHFTYAYLCRGDAYLGKSEPVRAVADYTEALRLDPLSRQAYSSRGAAYRTLGNLTQALNDLSEAIRLDPHSAIAYQNRASVHTQLKDVSSAVADLDEAIRLDATQASAFRERAFAHRLAGDVDKALTDLNQALRLNSASADALRARGEIHAERGATAKAIEDFSESIRIDQSNTAYLHRARAYARNGNDEGAIADCTAALEFDVLLSDAYRVRAAAYERVGMQSQAVADLTQLVRLEPNDSQAYHDRGAIRVRQGRHLAALADFSFSLRLNPSNAPALANRAKALRSLGKLDYALRDLMNAVLIEPSYAAEYAAQRGLVHAERGEHAQAIADFNIVLLLDPNHADAPIWREESLKARREQRRAKLPDDQGALATIPDRAVSRTDVELPTLPSARSEVNSTASTSEDTELELPETESSAPTFAEQQRFGQKSTLAIPDSTGDSTGPADYQAEQHRIRELETERLRQLAEKYQDEARWKQEAENASRKARIEKKVKEKEKNQYRNPEETAEHWRKIKVGAVFVAFFLIAGYYLVPLLWGLIPPSKNPYSELAVEKFVEEYSKDAARADEKFVDKVIVIRGKLKVVRTPFRRGQAPTPPKIFFATGEGEKIVVECQFDDVDVANDLRADTEYRVAGKVQRYKPRSPIALRQANVMNLDKSTTAGRTPWIFADSARRFPFEARLLTARGILHSPAAPSSRELHAANLHSSKEFTLAPRVRGTF